MPDAPFPIKGWWGSHPLPDLGAMPREQWEEALRQVPGWIRQKAVSTAGDMAGMTEASTLALRIDAEEHERRKAARLAAAFAAPLPGADGSTPRAPRSRYRQVNFRLLIDQHDELGEAAKVLAMKPAQLARLLTIRGVAQVLAEARAR